MGESKQEILTFDGGLQATYSTASDRMHSILRGVVKRADVKQGDDLAATLGIAGSHLSEALSGRGVKHFSLRWLPLFLHRDRDRDFLNYATGLVGCRVIDKEPLTPAQKLEMLRAELRENGANVEAIEERAFRRIP